MLRYLFSASLLLSIHSALAFPKLERIPEKPNLSQKTQRNAHLPSKNAFSDAKDVRKIDVQQYSLYGKLDWSKEQLNAVVDIDIKLLEATQSVILDSRVQSVSSVTLNNKPLTFQVNGALLRINLPQPMAVGEELKLRIQYTAEESYALRFVAPQKGDPVNSRVVYTISEPEESDTWMPCHNVPSDRARFDVTLEMPNQENMVANGKLISEASLPNSFKKIRYSSLPIPTYLMAFAAGDLVKTERFATSQPTLPLQVWARKGLPYDAQKILNTTDALLTKFNRYLGPFVFEKYGVVLLPDFPSGGVENASVSFQAEGRTSDPSHPADFSLTAHEFAHQWFGDAVTVRSWDDLWIKEGMATLLGNEELNASSAGDTFEPEEGDAVIDPALQPDDKYTSGPYDRAAWLYSQLRVVMGEAPFWNLMKTILQEHKLGSISTAEFLDTLSRFADTSVVDQFHRALFAKPLPQLEISPINNLEMAVTLKDPLQQVVAPVSFLTWVKDLNAWKQVSTTAQTKIIIARDHESIPFFFDRNNTHPSLSIWIPDFSKQQETISRYFSPQSYFNTEQQKVWVDLPKNFKTFALSLDRWNFNLETFPNEMEAMSVGMEYQTLRLSCKALASSPANENWRQAIQRMLSHIPTVDYPSFKSKPLSTCYLATADSRLEQELALVSQNPSSISEGRLELLSTLPFSPNLAVPAWKNLYAKGQSLRQRYVSLAALGHYLKEEFPPISEEQCRSIKSLVKEAAQKENAVEIVAVAKRISEGRRCP